MKCQKAFRFTFVGFPHPPRAERNYGNFEGSSLSIEFDAIYVERDAGARTGCEVRARDVEAGWFREKIEPYGIALSWNKIAYGGMSGKIRASSLWSARQPHVHFFFLSHLL